MTRGRWRQGQGAHLSRSDQIECGDSDVWNHLPVERQREFDLWTTAAVVSSMRLAWLSRWFPIPRGRIPIRIPGRSPVSFRHSWQIAR